MINGAHVILYQHRRGGRPGLHPRRARICRGRRRRWLADLQTATGRDRRASHRGVGETRVLLDVRRYRADARRPDHQRRRDLPPGEP